MSKGPVAAESIAFFDFLLGALRVGGAWCEMRPRDGYKTGPVCLVPSGELQGGRFQLNDLAAIESSHRDSNGCL